MCDLLAGNMSIRTSVYILRNSNYLLKFNYINRGINSNGVCKVKNKSEIQCKKANFCFCLVIVWVYLKNQKNRRKKPNRKCIKKIYRILCSVFLYWCVYKLRKTVLFVESHGDISRYSKRKLYCQLINVW